jgi:hypothetical protein
MAGQGMAEHGGAGRGGAGLSSFQLMDAQILRWEEEFRREDARRALLTPQELEEERAREMGTPARVPLFLTYDNGYAPIHWNLVRQEEGDNLPPLEELEEGDEPVELEEGDEPPPLEDGPPEDLRGGSRAGA